MRTLEIASLVVGKPQQPPPVPPPPNIDPLTEEFIAEQNAMPSFVPAPPPPPPPPPPGPPPPPLPPLGPLVQQQTVKDETDEKPQSLKTSTTASQVVITTDIIISAKERLRKSSGTAKKGLSADNADFLREKINEKFTNTFSESHESDSSDDDDKWNI